eukprot:UN06453
MSKKLLIFNEIHQNHLQAKVFENISSKDFSTVGGFRICLKHVSHDQKHRPGMFISHLDSYESL